MIGLRRLTAMNARSLGWPIASSAAIYVVMGALLAVMGERWEYTLSVSTVFLTALVLTFAYSVFKVRDFGNWGHSSGWRGFAVTVVRRRDLVHARDLSCVAVAVPPAVMSAVLLALGSEAGCLVMAACSVLLIIGLVYTNAWLLNGGSTYKYIRDGRFTGLGDTGYGQHPHVTATISVISGGLLIAAIFLGAMLSFTFGWNQALTVVAFMIVACLVAAVIVDAYAVRFFERLDQ